MRNFISGFRPAIYARKGFMLGIRQPLDGPVFEKLEEAEHWCIHAMISHFDRRLVADRAVQGHSGLWATTADRRTAAGHRPDLRGGGQAADRMRKSSI